MLSTGNVFTEFDLTRSNNTLIVGENGSGKSTILDALAFCYFGRPFRDINKPTIINSINNKECVVEGTFSVGKKRYRVVRGIKPNIFEIYCNDALLNQNAKAKDYQEILEKTILKMNFTSFTQIVALGAASFIPFMQLDAGQRRKIIEDLLDIHIFSAMNIVAKQKLSEIKTRMSSYSNELDKIDFKTKSINQTIAEISSNNQDKIDLNIREIESNNTEIAENQKEIADYKKKIKELEEAIVSDNELSEEKNKMVVFNAKLENNIDKLKKESEFYEKNDKCHTCHQDIEESFKKKVIDRNSEKIKEFTDGIKGLNKKLKETQKELDQIKETQKKLNSVRMSLSTVEAKTNNLISNNKKLEIENARLGKKTDLTTDFEKELTKLAKDRKNYQAQMTKDEDDRYYYDIALSLLKDNGIKTKIIKQYIPIINKLINKYLASMNFFVNFNLDENFEETIKSRHRDIFSYENFSEGEKQKIDLALLFTWRAVAKMKNSVSTNLLILDEVFDSSLDSNATDDLLKILSTLGSETNLFVISHREDLLFDKFRSCVTFAKKNNFSSMVNKK